MQIEQGSFAITGGASVVGARLAQELLECGVHRVTLIDTFQFGEPALLESIKSDPRVHIVKGDVLDLNGLTSALDGADGVFAAAALLTFSLGEEPARGIQVNTIGVGNTLEAASRVGASKVVLTSSVSVHGDNLDGLITENRPFGFESISGAFGIYAVSKLGAEMLGRWYAERDKVDFCAVRLATVYGERMHSRGVNVLQLFDAFRSAKAGRPAQVVGNGKDEHDYIHIDDVARGTLAAMRSGTSGRAYTLGTGVGTSSGEMVAMMARASGSDLPVEFIPDTRATRPSMNESLKFDVSAARQDLDWSAEVSVEEGVERLAAWLEQVGLPAR